MRPVMGASARARDARAGCFNSLTLALLLPRASFTCPFSSRMDRAPSSSWLRICGHGKQQQVGLGAGCAGVRCDVQLEALKWCCCCRAARHRPKGVYACPVGPSKHSAPQKGAPPHAPHPLQREVVQEGHDARQLLVCGGTGFRCEGGGRCLWAKEACMTAPSPSARPGDAQWRARWPQALRGVSARQPACTASIPPRHLTPVQQCGAFRSFLQHAPRALASSLSCCRALSCASSPALLPPPWEPAAAAATARARPAVMRACESVRAHSTHHAHGPSTHHARAHMHACSSLGSCSRAGRAGAHTCACERRSAATVAAAAAAAAAAAHEAQAAAAAAAGPAAALPAGGQQGACTWKAEALAPCARHLHP